MSSNNFSESFELLDSAQIHDDAEKRKNEGWRYVQILAVNLDKGVDLIYSYMKDGNLVNLQVKDIPYESHIPSISDLFLEAFVCENEIHDLFNISFDGLKIDFLGNFYRVETEYPMTIISPEKLAEREKQKKIAAAKAAKEKKIAEGDAGEDAKAAKEDALKEKLKNMDPEKAAKVKAALEAKAAKAKAEGDAGKSDEGTTEGEE